MKWNFNSKAPIYLQISDILRADILAGEYPVSTKFPTVRDLAVTASVNPNTMHKALQLLEAEGYLVTHRTTGRMVTDNWSNLTLKKEHKAKEQVSQLLQELSHLGYSQEEILALVKEELSCLS